MKDPPEHLPPRRLTGKSALRKWDGGLILPPSAQEGTDERKGEELGHILGGLRNGSPISPFQVCGAHLRKESSRGG